MADGGWSYTPPRPDDAEKLTPANQWSYTPPALAQTPQTPSPPPTDTWTYTPPAPAQTAPEPPAPPSLAATVAPDAPVDAEGNQIPAAPPPAQPAPPAQPVDAEGNVIPPSPDDTGKQGIADSLVAGLADTLRHGREIGSAFSATKDTLPPEVPRTWGGKLAYGVASSAPTMAAMGIGALGGGAAGEAMFPAGGGVPGAMIGGALGGGLMDFASQLQPSYEAAIRRGLSHDDAVNEAYKVAAASGVLTGATAPLFELTPFKSMVGKVLFGATVTNPAIGVAHREITPAITGQPAPSVADLVQGYMEDTITGLGLAGAQHGGMKLADMLKPDTRLPLNIQPEPTPPGQGQLTGPPTPEPPPPAPTPTPPPEPTIPAPAGPFGGLVRPDETPPAPPSTATPVVTTPVATPTGDGQSVAVPGLSIPSGTGNVPVTGSQQPVSGGSSGAAGTVPAGPPAVVPAPGGGENVSAGLPVPGPDQTPVPAPVAAPPAPIPVEAPQAPVLAPQPPDTSVPAPGPGETPPAATTQVAGETPPVPAPVSGQAPGPIKPSTPAPTGETQGEQTPTKPVQTEPGAQQPPAKRPVTDVEYGALVATRDRLRRELNKAQGFRSAMTPEQVDKLRQRHADAVAALDAVQGPPRAPVIGTYLKPTPETKAADQKQRDEYAAAVEAHKQAVTQRVHEEGTAPVPDTRTASIAKVFPVADNVVVRGQDTAGNAWVGTGNVLVREPLLKKQADQIQARSASDVKVPSPNAITSVTTPDPKATLHPVTWERSVTAPAEGKTKARDMVIGTLPDGTHVTVKKSIFDTLHAAAGKGGSVVAEQVGKKSEKLIAKDAKGDVQGVGMLYKEDQALARAYARGVEKPKPAEPVTSEPVSAPAKGPEIPPPAKTEPPVQTEPVQTEPVQAATVKTPEPTAIAAPVTSELKTVRANEIRAGDVIRTPKGEDLKVEAVSGQKIIAVQVEERTQPLVYPRAMQVKIHGEAGGETPPTEQLEARALGPPKPTAVQKRAAVKTGGLALPRRLSIPKRKQPVPVPYAGEPLTLDDVNYSPGTPRYMQAFHDALAGTVVDPGTAINKPIAEQINLLSNALRQKFSFGRVIIDPKVDPKVTRDQLLNMHQNMQGMAHALNWADKTLSLNGRLNLMLVPYNFRGQHWLGMYQPNIKTIHISGGSNSYAHEHWHAVDEYLSDMLNKDPNKALLFTHAARMGQLDPNDNLHLAFANVLNAIYYGDGQAALRRLALERTAAGRDAQGNPTQKALEAQKQIRALDTGASKLHIPPSAFRVQAANMPNAAYYSYVHELFARAGEAFTAWQMELKGQDTRGVVKSNAAYQNQLITYLKMAYPNAEDRVRIFDAFSRLVTELNRASVLPLTGPAALPPSEAHVMPLPGVGSPQVPPGFMAKLADGLRALSWSNLIRGEGHDSVIFPENRPAPPPVYDAKGAAIPRSRGVRAADEASEIFNTSLGNLERWKNQNPPAARPALQQILDKIGYQSGKRRWIPEPYENRARRISSELISRYQDILSGGPYGRDNRAVGFRQFSFLHPRSGVLHMTQTEREDFWHHLTTGETTYPLNAHDLTGAGPRRPIPDKVLKAAQQTRVYVLDKAYDLMKDAGLPIAHSKIGYAPRVMDDPKIKADPNGFKRDLTKANRVTIDHDFEEADAKGISAPERLHHWWADPKMAEARRSDRFTDEQRAAMKELGGNLNRMRQIEKELAAGGAINPVTHDPVKLAEEHQRLAERNNEIHDEHGDEILNAIAKYEADAFVARMNEVDAHDFITVGPRGEFLRKRSLPPEADQILRKWYLQDPLTTIPHYLHGVARRVAYHEVIGLNHSNVVALVNEAIAKGMHPDYGNKILSVIETLTGRSPRNNDAWSRTLNYISGIGAMTTLPRAGITSLFEPANMYLNGVPFKHVIGTYTNMIGHLFRTMNSKERMRITRLMGGIASELHGAAMASRFADYSGTPLMGRMVNAFYEMGMSPAQRMIRASIQGVGSQYMRELLDVTQLPRRNSRKFMDRLDDAKGLLREFGIRDEQMADMHTWLSKFQNSTPSFDELEAAMTQNDPMAELWNVSVVRMLDRYNVNPTAAEKPLGALKTAWGNAMAQLSTYLYGTMRNVVIPAVHQVTHAMARRQENLKKAGATPTRARVMSMGTAFHGAVQGVFRFAVTAAMVAMMYTPYQFLFNNSSFMDHLEKGDLMSWLVGGTFSQMGTAGPLDIPLQALESTRYIANLSNLTDGPYLSGDIRYLTDVLFAVEDAFKGDSKSNVRIYNGIYALMTLIGKPGLQAALMTVANRVPQGGIVHAFIRALSMGATSTTFTRFLTDQITGPKGTEITPPKAAATMSEDDAEPDEEAIPHGAKAPKKDTTGEGLPPGLNLGLTFADDAIGPLLSAMPSQVRGVVMTGLAAATAGAVLYRAYQFHQHGTPPKE